MKKLEKKIKSRSRRHARIRSTLVGTESRPRLAVFRSNKFIYAQLIDDNSGKTLAAASDVKATSGTKTERATNVGKKVAELANKKNINSAVFDRGGFVYKGRVKAVAEGARTGGLQV